MLVHIDSKSYTEKPKDHISIIKPRLQSSGNIKDVSVEELISYIEKGFTVSPAVMNGGCKAENFKQQQLFMLDFDNGFTPAEALKVCEEYSVTPAFYYYSFSHTDKLTKFRLCFVMSEVVTNSGIRKAIAETFIKIFPQCDTACRNADRLFFGTNKQAVICDISATVDIESILKHYEPPKAKPPKYSSDTELDRLKRDFDLFGYMKQRNGDLHLNNSHFAMFKECEICGHRKDLVYYHKTNTFYCFGANGGTGGSIIDYIVAVEHISENEAIDRLYELSGITRPTKREYAIKSKIQAKEGILAKLEELNAYKNYTLDDKGSGRLFADVYKDTCRFNATANEWYYFNGKVWLRDEGGMVVHAKAKEFTDSLLIYATTIEDEQQKKHYLDHVAKLGQLKYRETMIKDSRDVYFVTKADFDKNLDLFNCQNGTLNLKDFEFTPHNADDLLSKISNVIYDPSAYSDEWEKFINEIMQGDSEKIRYLQKILGYSLTANTELETCFFLYGATTRNGKSTLIETILYMLGNTQGYGMSMQPQTLAQKQNKDSRQASGDIARLDGCRFLNASEFPKRMLIDSGLLKNLLGRDSITARHLHEREFEFIPHFKLFINTNYLPLITDDTLFTSGRINVISFDRHFEPHEQNRNLKNILTTPENISGVFASCLEGLVHYIKEGAVPPKVVTNATEEYRKSSDKIGIFVEECMDKKSDSKLKALDVYSKYKEWCFNNGFGCENKSNFYDELKSKNMLSDRETINSVSVRNVVVGYVLLE